MADELLTNLNGNLPDDPDVLYKIASRHLYNGNLEEAIKLFNKVLSINPEHKLALFDLGSAYSRLGNYDSAIKCWRKVVSIDPNFIRAHFNLGLLYERVGRLSEAISELQIALSLVRTSGSPTSMEARIEKEIERLQNKKLKGKPIGGTITDVETQLQLGNIFLRQGKYEQAKDAFLEILNSIDPDNLDAHLNLGIVYFKLRDLQKAEQHFLKVIEGQPDNSTAYAHLGSIYSELGRHQEAISMFEKAIEYDPDNAFVYYSLARTYSKLGRYHESIPYYLKAVELNPLDSYAHNNLGLAYLECGKIESAIKHFLKAADLDPNDSLLYYNLAKAYSYVDNLNLAQRYIERAIELDPKLEYYLFYSDVLQKRRRYKESLQALSKALEIKNDSDEVYFKIAKIYSDLKKYDLAVKYITHAIKLNENPEYYIELASVYAMQGELQEALKSLKTALSFSPDNYRALRQLAILYIQTGELEKAQHCLEKLLQMNSSDPVNQFIGLKLSVDLPDRVSAKGFLPTMTLEEPQDSISYYYMGLWFLRRGLLSLAAEYLANALKLDPYNHDISYHYALALFHLKRFKDAKDILLKLPVDKLSSEGYTAIIECYRELGQLREAVSFIDDRLDKVEPTLKPLLLEQKYKLLYELGEYRQIIEMGPPEAGEALECYLMAIFNLKGSLEFLRVFEEFKGKLLELSEDLLKLLLQAYRLTGRHQSALELFEERNSFSPKVVLEKVKVLLDMEKFEEAYRELIELSAHYPQCYRDIEYINLYAISLVGLGEFKKADELISTSSIADEVTRIVGAFVAYKLKDYERTAQLLESINELPESKVQSYPFCLQSIINGTLRKFKARLQIQLNKLEPAEEELENYIQQVGNDYEAYYLLGVVKNRKKEFDDATWLLKKSIELNPHYLPARKALAMSYIEREMYDFAIEELLYVERENPYDYEAILQLGKTLFTQKSFSAAYERFQKVLQYNSSAWEAYYYIYLIELFKGKREVLRDLELLVSKFPDKPEVFEAVGYIYSKLNDIAKAESILKEGIDKFPDYPGLYINLGNLYLHQRKGAEALRVYTEGIKRTDNPQLYAYRGTLYYRANKYEEALRDFREALKRDNYNVLALTHTALIYINIGKLDEAIELFTKLLKTRPLNPVLYYNLGIAYERKGKYVEAKEQYEMALELNINEPNVYLRLLNIYKRYQDRYKASQLVNRALQDPRVPPNIKSQLKKELSSFES